MESAAARQQPARAPSSRNSPAGRRGNPAAENPITPKYRSKSEARVIPVVLAVGGEYESIRLPFPELRPSYYIPDAILPNGIVIEVKGRFLPKDRAKTLAVLAAYPDLDLRFVFDNPKRTLSKQSTTTYGDWCVKHGIDYAAKQIPESWLAEDDNYASLDIINQAPRRAVK